MHRISVIAVCLVVGSINACASGQELPPALAAVPGDAAAFVSVDVRALLRSPLCDDVRSILGAITPAELAAFAKRSPIDPGLIDRAVIVFPNQATIMEPVPTAYPTAVSALAIVGCSKPFDPSVLITSFSATGRPKTYCGHVYQFDDESWSGLLVLPGNKAFVVGAEDSLVWLIDRLSQGDVAGPLSSARAGAIGHDIFSAVNPAQAALTPDLLPPALQPLARAHRICLSIDFATKIRCGFALHYANPEGAIQGEQAAKALIDMGRGVLKHAEQVLVRQMEGSATLNHSPDASEFPLRAGALVGVGAVRLIDGALAKSSVERNESTVRYEFDFPFANYNLSLVGSVGAITMLGRNANATFTTVGGSIGGPAGPAPQETRLKRLAAAFDSYHAEHGRYPPAMTVAKDGTPLLSWRVALLPYLGEKKLYDEFRQNEPWDSLHNKKLIARMPAVFNKENQYPPRNGRTNTFVATGPGTLFDGIKGATKPAHRAVILALEPENVKFAWWTKPWDVPANAYMPPEIFHAYEFSTCWAVFTDGTTRQLRKKEDEKRLRELISPLAAGE